MPRRPPLQGTALGLLAVALAVAILVPLRAEPGRATPALVLVLAVVGAGLISGAVAAAITAIAAAVALNVFFIPPYGTLKVDAWEDWLALAVFLVVAVSVGLLVARATDRRQAAEARETELQGLYDRLSQVSAVREALEAEAGRVAVLARVDEQRAALLRSVSHDLRTPLATIRAVATDLRDGTEYDRATRTELLSTVCDETERLDRIVSNLLSLSRIEAGALKPERQSVPVDELVADRVRRLAPLFKRVRIQVELPPGLPLVDADYTQLDLVITNLLENAARHAPEGSCVRITGRPVAGPGDTNPGETSMVEVRVIDEGIGVPEYARSAVFEAFRQGERGGSSGVGLAICKAIVEAHGGLIRVDRTIGGGATFVFTVPVHR